MLFRSLALLGLVGGSGLLIALLQSAQGTSAWLIALAFISNIFALVIYGSIGLLAGVVAGFIWWRWKVFQIVACSIWGVTAALLFTGLFVTGRAPYGFEQRFEKWSLANWFDYFCFVFLLAIAVLSFVYIVLTLWRRLKPATVKNPLP